MIYCICSLQTILFTIWRRVLRAGVGQSRTADWKSYTCGMWNVSVECGTYLGTKNSSPHFRCPNRQGWNAKSVDRQQWWETSSIGEVKVERKVFKIQPWEIRKVFFFKAFSGGMSQYWGVRFGHLNFSKLFFYFDGFLTMIPTYRSPWQQQTELLLSWRHSSLCPGHTGRTSQLWTTISWPGLKYSM